MTVDWIQRRRSIRRFTSQDVSEGDVTRVLEAAMAAPSGHNLQPWLFIVIRDPETRFALAETHEFSGMIQMSPVVIAICSDPGQSVHWLEDACLAAENALLEAAALGLGAVWVAVYPHIEHEVYVRGVLDIPEHVRIVCLIPLGHPSEAKPPRTKYDATKVHLERFGQGRK